MDYCCKQMREKSQVLNDTLQQFSTCVELVVGMFAKEFKKNTRRQEQSSIAQGLKSKWLALASNIHFLNSTVRAWNLHYVLMTALNLLMWLFGVVKFKLAARESQ